MKHYYIVVISICMLMCVYAYADPLIINDNQSKYVFPDKLEVLEDKTGKLLLEDVQKPDARFVRNTKRQLQFGYNKTVYWVRFQVRSEASPEHAWLLEVDNSLLEELSLYVSSGNASYEVTSVSSLKLFDQRPIINRGFVLPLHLLIGKKLTVYMKVQSFYPFPLPIVIWSKDVFFAKDHKEAQVFGIFIGFILVMAIYNFFIFLSLKDKAYLYYVLYVLSFLFYALAMNGMGYELLWPFSPSINYSAAVLFGSLTIVFINLFLRKTVAMTLYVPRISKILNFVAGLSIINALLCLAIMFFSLPSLFSLIGVTFVNLNALVASLLMFPAIIIPLLKGYKPARYVLAGSSVLLIGAILKVLLLYAIVPANILTIYGIYFGAAMEAVLLSFALADRINILKGERDQAAVELQKMHDELERYAANLEMKVEERTAQLYKQNKELQKAYDQIQKQQAVMVQQEKIAALSDITASVAHEINTPLLSLSIGINNIIKYMHEMKTRYGGVAENENYDEEMKVLVQECGVIRKQVANMKSFIKFQDSQEAYDVNKELDVTLDILNYKILSAMLVEKNYDPALPKVKGNAALMNQVFMNIIKNAVEARRSDTQGQLVINTCQKDNGVVIEIRDNGIKQDPATSVNGTGMGLWLCRKIIDNQNGTITMERQGEWTIVRIVLTN